MRYGGRSRRSLHCCCRLYLVRGRNPRLPCLVCDQVARLATQALTTSNNVVAMYTSGSKGSTLNIAQIVACVGQQNVEGNVRASRCGRLSCAGSLFLLCDHVTAVSRCCGCLFSGFRLDSLVAVCRTLRSTTTAHRHVCTRCLDQVVVPSFQSRPPS